MPFQDWKKLIETFYPEFITFFFAELSTLIDFQRTPAFLNISSERTNTLHKLPFLLLGCRLKDDRSMLLLFVLEEQGYDNLTFGQQLFRSYAKVLEEYDYKFEVIIFVLFLGSSLPKDAERYQYQYFNTSLDLQFGHYVVREQYLEDLWQLDNPFAYLVAAQRLKQEYQQASKFLLERKLILFKKIIDFYQRSSTPLNKIVLITRLILDLLTLPDVLNKEFEDAAKKWLNTTSALSSNEKQQLAIQLWEASQV
jgi:hypothetical protein